NRAVIVVQKVSAPKRKRTQGVAEEIGQNDVVANEVDSEATNEEEVEPTIGISILKPSEVARYTSDMKKALNARKDDFIIQFRPKGPDEGSGIALEVSDEPYLKGSNEEAGVTPEAPDGLADDSSS
nr:hypothetical protein [Tanacetum cinerariifolium]